MSTTTTTPDTIHLDATAREALYGAVFLAGPGEAIARSKTAEEAEQHLEAARRTVALVRAAESGELPPASAGFALAEVADRRQEAEQESDAETIGACEHFAAVIAGAGSFPSRPVPLTERTAELLRGAHHMDDVSSRLEYAANDGAAEANLRDGLTLLEIVRAAEARELPAALVPRVRVLLDYLEPGARELEELVAIAELAEAIA